MAEQVDVLVVGAGFSGIGAAIELSRPDRKLVVLEKASEIGGTWRDNTYPGCACDVASALYSFSFAQKPDWSRAFAQQPEILDYLREVAERHGALEHVRLNTELLAARWDEADQRWQVETSAGPLSARVLIGAPGPLHEPSIPAIPGLDRFAGHTFHSNRWDHEHDLTGKNVAVVGTGASAVQFVPEIAPRVGHLTLFQRTPGWVLPKLDRPLRPREQALFRRFPAALRGLRSAIYYGAELIQLAQRKPERIKPAQKLAERHLRRSVRDPELRRALTPRWALGCKRILLSNDWYPALQRPNVDVVPHAVAEITETGLIGADGVERDADTIIFGTGFKVTDPPLSHAIRGRGGRVLAEEWGGSPRAHLGTTVAGFPNFFLLIGPNIGNGHSSALVLVEAQLRYVKSALELMERERAAALEVRREVQDAYNDEVQRALAGTVWNAGGCASYYLDRNGTNSGIYPWTTIDLRRRTSSIDPAEHVLEPAREPVAS